MKRIVCACICLLLACGMASAGAVRYDLSAMTLEELYVLRDEVNDSISVLEQSGDQHIYDSGSYRVGQDIPAGDYLLVENEDAMFASVLIRESESEDSDLLAHHLINRQLVIRLRADTWVTLSEARAYPLAHAPKPENDVTGEGGYLVGTLLPAGWYEVHLTEFAPLSSYTIYDGILGTDARLVKVEVVRDAEEIVLNNGEYIELSGCWLSPANH